MTLPSSFLPLVIPPVPLRPGCPGTLRGAGSPGPCSIRGWGVPSAGWEDTEASPVEDGSPVDPDSRGSISPLMASRSPIPWNRCCSFCAFRGRREAPGAVRAPRWFCACDGASGVHFGLLGCLGEAGIPFLFSVAEGFGLFYSLFQLWPLICFLANTGVGGKGIKAGFSLLSRSLPAP